MKQKVIGETHGPAIKALLLQRWIEGICANFERRLRRPLLALIRAYRDQTRIRYTYVQKLEEYEEWRRQVGLTRKRDSRVLKARSP